MNIRDRFSRPGSIRRVLAIVCFALAGLAFVWPVHARAASGASWTGMSVSFSGVHSAGCPWQVQLGSKPAGDEISPPENANSGAYLLDSFFSANCNAARYNRASQVLLLVIVGGLFGMSSVRAERRSRFAGVLEPASA